MPTSQYDWLTNYEVIELPISLEDYVTYVKADEHRFMGLLADNDPSYACGDCWPLTQRSQLVYALQQAKEMIENELGYSLGLVAHENERIDYDTIVRLQHQMLYSLGVWSVTSIETGITVNYASDPATISFDTTCDLENIEIIYPDSDSYSGATIRIKPKTMVKSGDTVTATIPWSRLVKLDLMGDECLDYEDTDNYITTVNAQCRTIDCTAPLNLVWLSSDVTCTTACGEIEQAGCGSIKDSRLGLISVQPATWNGASFIGGTPTYSIDPNFVDVSYIEGLYPLPYVMKQALIRLAHTLMPAEPCGCDIMQRMWHEDRGEAPVLAREQCPWGMMAGAWFAWQSLMRYRIGDGGLIVGTYL